MTSGSFSMYVLCSLWASRGLGLLLSSTSFVCLTTVEPNYGLN